MNTCIRYELLSFHSLVIFVVNDFRNVANKIFGNLNCENEHTVIGYSEAIARFNISI